MGWFQNLINRIRGNKPQQKLEAINPTYQNMPNNMNSLIIDVSGMNGKSREEVDLEQAVQLAERGYLPDVISSQFPHLTPSQIQACCNLAKAYIEPNDISFVGGTKVIIDRMVKEAIEQTKRSGYIESLAPNFMPNGENIVSVMVREEMQNQYKEQFRIKNPNRMPLLNQLYNSSIELATSGKILNEQQLIDYASRRGGYAIEVNGQNTGIQEVDVKATISLAYAVANNYVKPEQLKEVGGPAKIIDEMSIKARMDSREAGYLESASKEFLKHPTEVISSMPKEVTEKGMDYQ